MRNTTEKIDEGNVLELWAAQYATVTNWLNHLQRKDLNAISLYRFCQWAKKTPTELLDAKTKAPTANIVEKLLDNFCSTEDSLFKNSLKFQVSIAVKSFFHWNYQDLAKASGIVTLEKKKPYNKLSKELLRKLWSHALNLRDRALIPFVTCTAIAKETLSNLTWAYLEENWEQKDIPCIDIPSQLLKGHGLGRHKGVRQITFLTPEAKRELLTYKEFIEKKLGRKVRSDDHIWLDLREPFAPLTYASFATLINRLSKEASVPFSWHDGRRWVNTALEQIAISPNWARKIRGRKVKGEESPYSQPAIDQLRKKFEEAVPLLEFISEKPQVPQEVLDRLAALEAEKSKIRSQYRLRRKVTKPEEIEKCEDGKHCQQIVTEENLAGYLSQNWKVVATLPSGKIVIES